MAAGRPPGRPRREEAELLGPLADRAASAARELFGVHGVTGTSLQMIADKLGTAKAAVYYYYKTKDELIAAAFADDLADLESAIDEAEKVASEGTRADGLMALIPRLIAIGVSTRRIFGDIRHDPAIVNFMASDTHLASVSARIDRMMTVDDAGDEGLVRSAGLRALLEAVRSPLVSDIEDDRLRALLVPMTTEMIAPALTASAERPVRKKPIAKKSVAKKPRSATRSR